MIRIYFSHYPPKLQFNFKKIGVIGEKNPMYKVPFVTNVGLNINTDFLHCSFDERTSLAGKV